MSIFTSRKESFFQLDPTGQHINTLLIAKEAETFAAHCCLFNCNGVHRQNDALYSLLSRASHADMRGAKQNSS